MNRGRVAHVASALAILIGCSVNQQASGPVTLARFTHEDAVLFDDSFSPEVLGIGTGRPEGDPDLPSRVERSGRPDLCKPIHNLQVPNATKMGFIITYYSQSIRNSCGRDQDVGIVDQFTSSVKISIYCGCLHNYRIGERQYSARGTQSIKCGKLFCCPLASRPRSTSYRVMTEKVNCRCTSR